MIGKNPTAIVLISAIGVILFFLVGLYYAVNGFPWAWSVVGISLAVFVAIIWGTVRNEHDKQM